MYFSDSESQAFHADTLAFTLLDFCQDWSLEESNQVGRAREVKKIWRWPTEQTLFFSQYVNMCKHATFLMFFFFKLRLTLDQLVACKGKSKLDSHDLEYRQCVLLRACQSCYSLSKIKKNIFMLYVWVDFFFFSFLLLFHYNDNFAWAQWNKTPPGMENLVRIQFQLCIAVIWIHFNKRTQ